MLTKETCQKRVVELVQSYCDAHNKRLQVSESTDLPDAGFTSLDIMELIEAVEDEFDIALPINDLADVRSVEDLAKVALKAAE